MSAPELFGWDRLRHGGLLLDPPRLRRIAEHTPDPLRSWPEGELRRQAIKLADEPSSKAGDFVSFVFEEICGFGRASGTWSRGPQVGAEWGRQAVTGETLRPRQLWKGSNGAVLAVFIDSEPRLGIGKGRRAVSRVLQWLRAGGERLAVLTNGRQWRLVFAGLDFDAWCEWDVDLWFEEGGVSPQVDALRTLLQPVLWTPATESGSPPLIQAILDSRKGQAELSAALGERVREAVEILVQQHGDVLKEQCANVDPAEVYRAAVRVVMRMVVVLFAEARELLPRDNPQYHRAYGLTGLLEELEKVAARGGGRLARSWGAWPRVLALFRLVHQGSHHPGLPVPAYGGELFAPGDPASPDGLTRALAVFESACFDRELLPDREVHRLLERITRTRVKVRQGRSSTKVPVPVDFSDLSSEYIGILYEGLLDFELKVAPAGDPIVFLAVGNQPALPLSRLEAMDDASLKNLLEKMKDTSTSDDEDEDADAPVDDDETGVAEDEPNEAEDDEAEESEADEDEQDAGDERQATRTRAEVWARRAVKLGGLVKIPRGGLTPEKRLAFEDSLARKARQLVTRVVLPGEHYLVRWGGTRKGSGTFYTRPGLAVPTVQRTLRPLAYAPPMSGDGRPDRDAPPSRWTPKTPEAILKLKVVDPACGSGTFPVAALRFLTDALYASLHHHGRVREDGDRAVVKLLSGPTGEAGTEETLHQELLPCRPDDPVFEARLKAVLRRHVVERCLYGVDLDPLAVELCRLALWVETMDRTLPFSFLDHKIKCGNSLVGAWFDTFQHYPVMAWKNREAGDKNHTNGVHYGKEERTKAIKAWVKETLTPDLQAFLQGRTLYQEDLQQQATAVHDQALATLRRLHELPVHDSAERSRIYREELLGSHAYSSLKRAMDLCCACWFWPAEELEHAPLPSTLARPEEDTIVVADRLAAEQRFFHWELEFPDVFRAEGTGFDAALGNPPWDIAKPSSKEFFSNHDPLYRAYGKQEALRRQTELFEDDEAESSWLEYSATFKGLSNFVSYASSPFGDPLANETSADRFSIKRGRANEEFHSVWRRARAKSRGFGPRPHPFRHQGSADLNLYKLFLEQAHAVLRSGGRMGFIVPSGLYSDKGTGPLRTLFLEHCSWEWLFGFENREKVFEIDSRFKFNPVIVEKGGRTEAIRTAFMRRKLEDWEVGETLSTPYTREQVDRFSPRSKAILEIQSSRDLEILEKIYANSVLLGDEGPQGWGITYRTEFHMTNDSKQFPPRPKWEAQGYRPDEYSRWLKGDWRPIDELWRELGVDPSRPVPIDPTCEREIAERGAEVQRTDWRLRCAQPPYDTLPIPRADIPEGIILSREGDEWVAENRVESISLPIYVGRMISVLNWNAETDNAEPGAPATLEPAYLLSAAHARHEKMLGCRLAFRDIARTTDQRTCIPAVVPSFPCGNVLPLLELGTSNPTPKLALASVLASFILDWSLRLRMSGTHLNLHVIESLALPRPDGLGPGLAQVAAKLCMTCQVFAPDFVRGNLEVLFRRGLAYTPAERLRLRIALDSVAAALFGLTSGDLLTILEKCDEPSPASLNLPAKGFWRVDKGKDPELRHTVLTLVAFRDLEKKIDAHGGDRVTGIQAFLDQSDSEGWMLPETLRLADYGLGHDDRAKHYQPVASPLGPRFYDWQLALTPEESWRECHLHARNLLGRDGFASLSMEEIVPSRSPGGVPSQEQAREEPGSNGIQPSLFGH